ncbi:hypothetical protein C8R44DRAFT_774345 [Mycena epipterygia]|nr:hypothetical protein C8R44DRAFT_774345 [Mycena epipterygia]
MGSPFAEHFHTNYVPSEAEMERIRVHLIAHSQEVLRLDSIIQDLASQRDKLVHYIDSHKALISPARRLPRDIVQEIFIACLPTHRNPAMSCSEAPLLLGRICSGWRTIALSTSALWASLHIPLEFVFQRGLEGPVAEWLDRSARSPLFVSIVGSRSISQRIDDDGGQIDRLMRALSGSADRWRAADLSFREDEGLLMLFGETFSAVLESVTVTAHPSQIVQLHLLKTQSLRSVTLRTQSHIGSFVPSLPLHWNLLSHLSFEGVGLSLENVLTVVQMSSQLISLQFTMNGMIVPESLVTSSAPPLILPSLKIFTVLERATPIGALHIELLIRRLRMPQLRHFQMPRTFVAAVNSPFLVDLAMHSPLIEHLVVELTRLTMACLSHNLHMLPHLKTLAVTDTLGAAPGGPGATVNALLTLLTPPEPGPNPQPPLVCPRLAELRIREWDGESDLLQFARRRVEGSRHFRRLDVHYAVFTPDIPDAVKLSFLERGLHITTDSPAPSEDPPPGTPWTGLEV